MKPSKNRIYCRDCGRMKTVFDSEEAAMRFIQYNKRDIIENSGYAPTRAYYCDLCCAWHVTSKKGYSQKSLARRTVDSIMEFNNLKKSQRLCGKSTKKITPSESPAAPFLTEAYNIVLNIIGFAKEGKVDQAKEQCNNLDILFEKMTLVKGAVATRRSFSEKYQELRDKIYEGTLDSNTLYSIEEGFNVLYEQNPSIFSYDINDEGAKVFDLTPENIDSVYFAEQYKEEAKVNIIKNINALLMSASASIACGDFSDAKKDLIEASELIENLDDQESIKKYSKEIVKLIDKIESESEV